jgi:CBS domain-containing protein
MVSNYYVQSVKVSEIMTKKVLTVDPATSLSEAARKMYENRIGCLVVVEGRRCVGIITERDFVRLFYQRAPVDGRVGEYMTTPAVMVSEDTSVNEARNILETHSFRHLPVVDRNGSLVGIVSIRDIYERVITLI